MLHDIKISLFLSILWRMKFWALLLFFLNVEMTNYLCIVLFSIQLSYSFFWILNGLRYKIIKSLMLREKKISKTKWTKQKRVLSLLIMQSLGVLKLGIGLVSMWCHKPFTTFILIFLILENNLTACTSWDINERTM